MILAFLKSESGAIAIEWVVGLSAIATLAMAVLMSISGGTQAVSREINDSFTPISMDLMDMAGPVTISNLIGSSAYNVLHGGEPFSQVNCQHYAMSNGETWKNCTESPVNGGPQAQYWLNAEGEMTDAPHVNQGGGGV